MRYFIPKILTLKRSKRKHPEISTNFGISFTYIIVSLIVLAKSTNSKYKCADELYSPIDIHLPLEYQPFTIVKNF
jgi:hypothetical protein